MNKAQILAEAESLGFSFTRVTFPQQPAHFSKYEKWLADGRSAGMSYLGTQHARELRANPEQVLPGVRSILVLGMQYDFPAETEARPGFGRVSSYAWGEDYHILIKKRLEELANRMRKNFGQPFQYGVFTDSSPILEREFASQAGLGWIGKNTCLIHPVYGSFFFLSEIFLETWLEPDHPFTADRCGTCQRCIETCPTKCILEDRTLDAGRCISYLTIENKGSIPRDLRSMMGDRVFGCDVCQAVCPWNQRIMHNRKESIFSPNPSIAFPNLQEELELTPQIFNHRFKNSAVKRAKRKGYLRNICTALGNQKDPDAIVSLEKVLESERETLVREHAAWALGQIGTTRAQCILEKALIREPDEFVRKEIEYAISIL